MKRAIVLALTALIAATPWRFVVSVATSAAIVFHATPAYAAITVGTTGNGRAATCDSGATAGTTTMQCTITVDGSDKLLVCWAGANDNAANDFNATWQGGGGEALTDHAEGGETTGRYVWVGYKIAPTDGTTTVDFSNLSAAARDAGGCVLLNGVDQNAPDAAPTATSNAGCGDPFSSPQVTSGAGDLIFSAGSASNTTSLEAVNVPTDTGAVLIAVRDNNFASAAAYDDDGGETNETIDWDTNVGPACAVVAFNINVASAAAGAVKSRLLRGFGI